MEEESLPLSRRRAPIWLVPLLIVAVSAWYVRPDARLHVIFLNTPGDAVLVIAPGGNATLIDGGRDPALLALQLGRYLPFYKRDLQAIVLSGGGGSRLPGQVAALAHYHPALALVPPALSAGGTVGEWLRLTDTQRTPVRLARPGDRLALGGGALLTVLGLAEGQDGGMLFEISYGATRLLLHMGGPELDDLARSVDGPVSLLAYPWQREPDAALLARLRPQAIVFSDGYTVDEPALLSYADRAYNGARIYHEKNEGTVELISDGQRAWIKTGE